MFALLMGIKTKTIWRNELHQAIQERRVTAVDVISRQSRMRARLAH